MHTRRDFLRSASLLALAPTVPGFLARAARAAAPERDRRVLVVVQMDGGNDGLNTVVPFADDHYATLRPNLKVAVNRLHKIDDQVGLHPSLAPLKPLWDDRRLAVVHGSLDRPVGHREGWSVAGRVPETTLPSAVVERPAGGVLAGGSLVAGAAGAGQPGVGAGERTASARSRGGR